mmetsp:Transcript_3794/g.14415  ORF Transcript_3794/g.14415 Transcript_3794/m.14415 type:complete len:108 (-) Transcript_3794:133-456(-)
MWECGDEEVTTDSESSKGMEERGDDDPIAPPPPSMGLPGELGVCMEPESCVLLDRGDRVPMWRCEAIFLYRGCAGIIQDRNPKENNNAVPKREKSFCSLRKKNDKDP